jgi:hypothetical protein
MPEDKPILTPEEAKAKIRKTREDMLPKVEDIIEGKAPEPDEKIPNEPLPEYPFKDQTKKKKAEPNPSPLNE